MKLLHTSDWHLGAGDDTFSYEEDQRFFIDEICNIVKEQKIDAVMIAGDIYDKSILSADSAKLFNEAMTKLCMDCRVPVLCIAGNHDSAEKLANCNMLLERAGLFICGEIEKEIKYVELGNAQIFMLPWISEGKVKSVFREDADSVTDITSAYCLVTSKMKEQFIPDKKHILMAHAFVVGAELSDSDRAASVGNAVSVPKSVFEGFDYVALGHIHRPQDISENIRYSGTPMPYSFGKEEKQEKSVTVIDTDTMQKTIIPLKLCHKRVTITGELEKILSDEYDDETKKGYTKIVVTDNFVGNDSIARIKSIFPNAMEISGKIFENENSKIRMTVEEFRSFEGNPVEIFKSFYEDENGSVPDNHLVELFSKAVEEVEKEQQ